MPDPGQGLQLDYVELGVKESDSPTEFYDAEGGRTAKRRIRVAWEDREEACHQICGYPLREGPGLLSRYLPDTYISDSGVTLTARSAYARPLLWKEQLNLTEFGQNVVQNVWDFAIIEIDYYLPKWKALSDSFTGYSIAGREAQRYTIVTAEPSDEVYGYYGVGENAFGWASNAPRPGEPFPQTINKVIQQTTYRLEWLQVPKVPDWTQYVGTVNEDIFTIYGPRTVVCEAHTLLCRPPKIEYKPDARGKDAWNICYVFVHRPTSWNKYLDVQDADPDWYQVIAGTDKTVIVPGTPRAKQSRLTYNDTNFNNLWVIP